MAASTRGGRRFLATVLFTDIVDSTRLASELGDEAWRNVLAQHHELVRRQLRRFDGREIDTAGDGFFAVFDAPAQAVGCALAISVLVEELAIDVRAGVHAGELEEMGRRVGGIGVHIGARVCAAAAAGEVLVTATVRDLVVGSGYEFTDRGAHELKGVPGEWRLYEAHRPADATASDGTRTSARAAATEVAAVRHSIAERKRRRRLLIGAGVGLAGVVGVSAGLVVTRPPPSLPAVSENEAGVIDLASGRILAQVPVGARPDGVAFGENAIWVANYTDGTVSRIDPRTRTVVQTIEVGAGPSGLATGFGSVWVANSDARSVSRINASNNRVVQTIDDVGNGPTGVAVGAGAVWVTNAVDGTVMPIDPATGATSVPINVGVTPAGIAADDTAVWVANQEPGTVSKIDPATKLVVDSIPVGNGPRGVAIGEGSVWIANSRDGTVSRIDIAASRVIATIPVGEGASAVSVASGVAWVGASLADVVYRINADTNTATPIDVGAAAQGLAIGNGQLWFSARASPAGHRGGTLNVVTSGEDFGQFFSIDPAVAFAVTAWSILSMTNDGLVTYEHVGGIAGASVVPDLAVALPRPTDGGKSYTFQLRPGLTYSNGEPIRPEDFRRAIERNFSVPAPDALTGGTFLGGIVGAEACLDHIGEPCDLSGGIVTDASTVTFHLTAPDPDFLYKLALPFGDAVPASSPDHDVGREPLPATGAYMIASYTDNEIRVVRNPMFHEWSRAARPDGFPDEILVTIGPSGDEQMDMVVGGTADVMSDRADASQISAIQLQHPALVHPAVLGAVSLFMNTSLAPFDDVQVRRAVNFAIDRGRVVELLGGPLSDRVSCQIIPPNTPGHAPYCPYTLNVNPAGAWSAPDLATARDLIAASGNTGTSVSVHTFGRFRAAAAYIVDLLNALGFVADVVEAPDRQTFFDELTSSDTGELIQAGTSAWIPDFPSASSATVPYRCTGDVNFARFCDPTIESLIDSAIELQQTDPVAAGQRWAEVDRAIVDLAPVAPLSNPVFVDVVSERVGNYQRHPEWGVLLDQLWVK